MCHLIQGRKHCQHVKDARKRLPGIRKRKVEDPGLEAFGCITAERKLLWPERPGGGGDTGRM